jgi:Domain of unknown function (DUF4386)
VNPLAIRRAAGTLLVIVPIVFTACFLLLQQLFEYPDILRQPTADVLTKFAAGGTPLIAVWYVLTLTAVAFVPLVLLVHRALAEHDVPLALQIATVFGLIAGFSQTLGLFRISRSRTSPPARPRHSARPPGWCSKPSTATPAWPSASTSAT